VELAPIPEDDLDPARQQERRTVKWLFNTFAREHVSYRWLAEQLNPRGVPGPGINKKRAAAKWSVGAVARILQNPVYKAVFRYGKTACGKYSRLMNGEVTAVEFGAAKTENVEGVIEVPLGRGGYVSAGLWDDVQAKARERAEHKIRSRVTTYVLPTGILHCGHCGCRMYGTVIRPKRNGKVYEYRKYMCSSPIVKPGTCRQYNIDENELVNALVGQLQRVYLSPRRLEGLEAALLERAETQRDNAPADTERLRQQLAKLEETIVRNRRRVLDAEDDATYDELNKGLRELVQERQRLEKELAEVQSRQTTPADTAEVKDAVARLRTLGDQLHKAKGRKLGEVLRLLVSRVELHFEERFKGKKRKYAFVKGEVMVRPILDGDVKGYGRFVT
jgi:hypothetical protein